MGSSLSRYVTFASIHRSEPTAIWGLGDLRDDLVFQGWANFYLMTGSASAGLTGLLFVVVTLLQVRERSQTLWGAAIYMTPTVLSFAVVLSVSAVATAPSFGPPL